ncbi:MAG: hypothetical protein AAGK93_12430, partial [Pseudomonadota bacterium]
TTEEPFPDGWGARATSAKEALDGLKQAIGPCITSSVFLGSTIFVGMALADFSSFGALDEMTSPWAILYAVLSPMCIMVVIMFAMIFAAVLLVATAAWTLARMKDVDPLTMAELAQQAFARLLMGGMPYVQPDQEAD